MMKQSMKAEVVTELQSIEQMTSLEEKQQALLKILKKQPLLHWRKPVYRCARAYHREVQRILWHQKIQAAADRIDFTQLARYYKNTADKEFKSHARVAYQELVLRVLHSLCGAISPQALYETVKDQPKRLVPKKFKIEVLRNFQNSLHPSC